MKFPIQKLRSAFTLVEMLIAMALTLILVYAIAEFYAYIGNAVRDGRATIEMGGQLRAAAQQLNDDLQSLTLRPTPWIDPTVSPGYFSVYEGPGYDADPDANTIATNSLVADADSNTVSDLVENNKVTNLFGDGDDVLAFTIRAKDTPFQGRYNGAVISSNYAEVIWFTTFVDTDNSGSWSIGEYRFLCRRLLLIVPNVQSLVSGGANGVLSNPTARASAVSSLAQIQQDHDISATIVQGTGSNYFVRANSLAALSLRQNRFACSLSGNAAAISSHPHGLDMNPNLMNVDPANTSALRAYVLDGGMLGEDRMLSNVLAFDARVWDPEARVYSGTASVNGLTHSVPLVAGDPGYGAASANEGGADPLSQNPPRLVAATPNTAIGVGAYVDLFYNSGINREGGNRAWTHFSRAGNGFGYGVWDTWPTSYETSGPGNGRAVNGLDDDGVNGIDDPGERQTEPPYFTPLRGIQVRIRVYEPQTRQMRQVTVGADFVGD